MTRPAAYEPAEGYRFQILTRHPEHARSWEHCDYAKDRAELTYLIGEYRLAYGAGWQFRTLPLPRKYWPAKGKADGTA